MPKDDPETVIEAASALRMGHWRTVLLAAGEAMLQTLGYAVIPVSQPEQVLPGVEWARQEITSSLSRMNGKELARRLSVLRPGVPETAGLVGESRTRF